LTGERVTRRLAAILAADVVGYSRLMGRDEQGTLNRLKAHRAERLEPTLVRHGGRLVKLSGDGALAEFPSAVDALNAAIEFQQAMADANRDQPEETAIVFRIGLHLGDLIVEGDDLYGDGVNVAARLEAAAPAGGIVLSGGVHDAVVGRLRAAFEDLGDLSLKNIERPVRAYRVRVEEISASPATAISSATDAPLALPDKPSIAVLPFQNMSGDLEQEYFADGMVEDIITALSRFRSLFVIARNSSFTYKGKSPDIRQVGRELGVRYVLEGSVRKAGGKLRITGQLIDCKTGAHLWADRFDGSLEDVFELQDQVTMKVVGAIAPRLEKAEIDRAQRKPIENLDAYDCFLRGMAEIQKQEVQTRESFTAAQRLFYQAIELDPGFSTPYAMAARCFTALRQRNLDADRKFTEGETRRLVSRVSEIGKDDAQALCWAGHAMAAICHDLPAAVALIDQGLAINQNLAVGWQLRGLTSVFLGNYDEAREQAARAMRLNPLDPEVFRSEQLMTLVSVYQGRYDEAVAWAKRVELHNPSFHVGVFASAAANALAGNADEAQRQVRRILERQPEATVTWFRDNRPGGLARPNISGDKILEGLRLAGLPD